MYGECTINGMGASGGQLDESKTEGGDGTNAWVSGANEYLVDGWRWDRFCVCEKIVWKRRALYR